jgi:hypothetical protein
MHDLRAFPGHPTDGSGGTTVLELSFPNTCAKLGITGKMKVKKIKWAANCRSRLWGEAKSSKFGGASSAGF